jgi:hypothetical protein
MMFKGSIKQRKNELKSYKSFKHFSEQEFFKELQGMNFNNISKHEDLDEAYSNFANSIIKMLLLKEGNRYPNPPLL